MFWHLPQDVDMGTISDKWNVPTNTPLLPRAFEHICNHPGSDICSLAEMDNVMNKGGVHFVFDKTQQNSLKV
jgi:hypothetical protein